MQASYTSFLKAGQNRPTRRIRLPPPDIGRSATKTPAVRPGCGRQTANRPTSFSPNLEAKDYHLQEADCHE
jgi:hypothetical protein